MIPDPFDCQEFHELCMDYRGASFNHPGRNLPQEAYERLQQYCRRVSGLRKDGKSRIERAIEYLEAKAAREQQASELVYPKLTGFEPFDYTERS